MTESTTITQPRNGLGTAGMVLGIIGAAIGLIPFLGLMSFLIGPLAVILGAVGWTRTRGARRVADNPVASLFGVGLGVAGVLFASMMVAGMNAAFGGSSATPAGSSPQAPFSATTGSAMGDVKVSECNGGSGQFGLAKVTVRITNSTDQVQSYFVTVSVNDAAGNRLGEANGASNSVAPGQSANAELLGGATEGAANCTVASVNRFRS
jgi:hypothetical protein